MKNWKSKTVLIVEDDNSNFYLLKEMLKPSEIKVLRAINGYSAIEMCSSEKPDIVLMDIKLPQLDGITATVEIKKSNPDLPILAQTAFALLGDKEKCLESGCDDYIAKPLMRTELFEKMEKLLSNHSS
jgi:two-component system cell cycle response regulator DivK